ncbi:TPA: hypothetical protein DEB02_04560 [Candidatus Beckwithbacteria bacterium]|nr:hypothetical protein [Candidatus Beckwithbacteria bacterium]
MAITNLLTKIKGEPNNPPEYFFAIEIDADSVKSAVWTVEGGQTKVVKVGSVENWDGQDARKLLEAVDQSISQASENLSQEPSGAIFGLPESWQEEAGIAKEKKSLLKTLCSQLELKPLGFVVTATALIAYLKIEEGAPVSAIFIQIDPSGVNLNLVKLGKVVGSQLVGRSNDLGADVEEALSRFSEVDTLPSRMILYDGNLDFEEARQQLTSYDWEKKLPFIHFPKVEVLPQEASIKAVALSGGSEVAKSLGFTITPSKPASSEPTTPKKESEVKPIASDLGFVADQDVAEKIIPQTAEPVVPETPEPEPTTETTGKSFVLKLSSVFTMVKSLAAKLGSRRPRALLAAIIFFLLFSAVSAAYWYIPKATITLVMEPKTIEANLTATFDPDAETQNVEENIVPAQNVDVWVSGQESAPTTGSNVVGELATGAVTIFNKTSSSKAFPSGTTLIGPDNLAFTLDEDTTVASRSSEEDSEGVITITPGKATGNVSAKSIGPEGNLSADTKLTFRQFSEDDFYAKTDSGLSGGSAREVKAVSEADRQDLLSKLSQELLSQAQDNINQQFNGEKSLVKRQDQEDLLDASFSHDVDEETDSLTLEGEFSYTALAFRSTDLTLLLQEAVKEKVPENFQVSPESKFDLKPASLNSDGSAIADVVYAAKLIPKLDFSEMKNQLAGRSTQEVQDYLASLPNFVKADIALSPKLPGKSKTLPRAKKNIIIKLELQE